MIVKLYNKILEFYKSNLFVSPYPTDLAVLEIVSENIRSFNFAGEAVENNNVLDVIDVGMLGKAHKNSLDNMSVAQMRVVLEHLLFTMEFKQRRNLMSTFPGLYKMIFPEWENK